MPMPERTMARTCHFHNAHGSVPGRFPPAWNASRPSHAAVRSVGAATPVPPPWPRDLQFCYMHSCSPLVARQRGGAETWD